MSKKTLIVCCCQCHNRYWLDGSWQDLSEEILLTRESFSIENAKCDRCIGADILSIAEKETGIRESAGSRDTARILEYHACTSLKSNRDETPWCSAFVNWVIKQAGGKGTNSAAARSWLKWGQAVKDPYPGCIVVLKRGAPPAGHVGFFVYRRSPAGWVQVLGGNQTDRVKVSFFQESDVLGYRAAVNIIKEVYR
jgi:uncharacterized protein (TIGR02594 family)